MHEVAGSSPVESTKTPRFGIAVAGCFLLRFFGRARGWEPLCASKAFSPRYTLLTLSSGENKRLIIVWRGAPLQARALSNPPKHPVSALPFRGVFLLRVAISFTPYKKRRTKSIRCLSYGVIFCFCTENGFYLTPPPPPPCPPPEKPPKCPPLPPPPRNVPPPLGFGRDIADTNDERSMELSST